MIGSAFGDILAGGTLGVESAPGLGEESLAGLDLHDVSPANSSPRWGRQW